jgi:hypothetical protein
LCGPFIEVIRPKEEVFADSAFNRLGFADVSILGSLDAEMVVLTDDAQLYSQVLYLEKNAINFNHLRRIGSL